MTKDSHQIVTEEILKSKYSH